MLHMSRTHLLIKGCRGCRGTPSAGCESERRLAVCAASNVAGHISAHVSRRPCRGRTAGLQGPRRISAAGGRTGGSAALRSPHQRGLLRRPAQSADVAGAAAGAGAGAAAAGARHWRPRQQVAEPHNGMLHPEAVLVFTDWVCVAAVCLHQQAVSLLASDESLFCLDSNCHAL